MDKTKSVNRLFLATVICVFGVSWIIQRFGINLPYYPSMVLGEAVIAFPALLYLLIKRIPAGEWIPHRKLDGRTVGKLLLLTVLLLPLMMFLNALSMLFSTNYVAQDTTFLQDNSIWLNLLVIAVIPAVFEEFCFRGVLYGGWRENGPLAAAVVCGITFGLMHRNLNQFFYAAVLGFVFSVIVEATGSVFASMAVHFFINGWSVLLIALMGPLSEYLDSALGSGYAQQLQQEAVTAQSLLDTLNLYGPLAVICTALAGCVMVWIARGLGRQPELRGCFTKKGQRFWSVWMPSLCLACGFCIGYMVMLEVF